MPLAGVVRCQRGRSGQRTLPVQVVLVFRLETQQFAKAVSELGRHQVVEYRVHCRVQVQHDATEVQQVVILLDADAVDHFGRFYDNPQRQRSERQQTQEERHNYRSQHHDHLPPVAERGTVRRRSDDARIGHQMARDHGVQDHEDGQRQTEEQRYGEDEV